MIENCKIINCWLKFTIIPVSVALLDPVEFEASDILSLPTQSDLDLTTPGHSAVAAAVEEVPRYCYRS